MLNEKGMAALVRLGGGLVALALVVWSPAAAVAQPMLRIEDDDGL